MPLQVTTHPVEAPHPGGSNELELCDWGLGLPTAPAPSRATFQTQLILQILGLRRLHKPPTSCSIRLNSISLKAIRAAFVHITRGISRGLRPSAACRSYPVARRLAPVEGLPLELFVAISWSSRKARFTEPLSGNARATSGSSAVHLRRTERPPGARAGVS